MRLPDWPERLADYVESMRDDPFEWGKNDCATFAAGAVEAITGKRPELPIYNDSKSYLLLIQETSMADRLTAIFGQSIPVAFAQRGDVVILDHAERLILSICMGSECVSPSADGIYFSLKPNSGAAWKVG